MKTEPKANLLDVLKGIVDAKDMDDVTVQNALKEALVTAARKYLHIDKKIDVDIDVETNEIHMYLRVNVVDDYPDYDPDMSADEVEELDKGYMLVPEAQEFNEDAQVGDTLEMEIPIASFGRQAIQTAKQLLNQQIRDAESKKIIDTYRSRIGSMINGEVLRLEQRSIIVKLGKQTEAKIPEKEQIKRERWEQGNSIKAVIESVDDKPKDGIQIILSRASGNFLKELFRNEVPEIYDGSVEIKGVAREPGFRAKIAVYSRDEKIDPVGACVGMKGARVQTIVRELGNERIDIVQWNPDLDVFIQRALAPANVVKLIHVPNTKRTVVIINDENADALNLAIGRNGQNIKLAAQLVERNLDVFGEKEWSEKDDEDKAKITQPSAADLNPKQPSAADLNPRQHRRDSFKKIKG